MKQHKKNVSQVQSLLKNEFLHNNSNPSKGTDDQLAYYSSRNDAPLFRMDNPFMQLGSGYDNMQGARNSMTAQGNTSSNTNFSPPFTSMLGTPGQQTGAGLRNMFNPMFPPASPIMQMGMFSSETNTPMMNMFDCFMNKNQSQNNTQIPNSNSIHLANGLFMNPLRRPEAPANSNSNQDSAQHDTSGLSGGQPDQQQQKEGSSLLINNLSSIPEEPPASTTHPGEQGHTNTTTLSSPPSNTHQFAPHAPSSFSCLPPSANLFTANVHPFAPNGGFMQSAFPFNTPAMYPPTSFFGYNSGLDFCFDDNKLLKGADHLGSYSREERMQKIMKYKNKIQKWRDSHPVNRAFTGRSKVAGNKPRVKGRFVKASEYIKIKGQGEDKEEAPTQLTSDIHGGRASPIATPEQNNSMQIENPVYQ